MMNPEVIKLLANGGASLITLVMAWVFLRYLNRILCSFKQERQDFLKTINNHIHENTMAIEKQDKSINRLDSSVAVLSRIMDKLLDKL